MLPLQGTRNVLESSKPVAFARAKECFSLPPIFLSLPVCVKSPRNVNQSMQLFTGKSV